MFKQLARAARLLAARLRTGRRWSKRTLVVGPSQPVDGDSVGCTKAMIIFLRKLGLEAFTLPTLTMYDQLDWILDKKDFHRATLSFTKGSLTSDDLQGAFDALVAEWRPDEIVLVDGQPERIGFNPRGIPVYTIDHHIDAAHEDQDDEKGYVKAAPAAGCLLIERFKIMEPILAVSILTDTFWLRHHWPARASQALATLTKHGLTDELLEKYQRKLMVRKNPQILESLKNAHVVMSRDRKAVCVLMRERDPELHRGVMSELGYFFRHIATVRGDGYTSLRTVDPDVDLREFVKRFAHLGSAGGHANQSAIQFREITDVVFEELSTGFFEFVRCKPRG